MSRLGRVSLIALLLLAETACSTLPRDPEKTLERVERQRRIRVGLVENPPWVVRAGGNPAGAEVELATRFAASLGATPQWFWGAEQRHMEALERFELDLVIAGLDQKTPWSKKVGLTRPYFEEQVVIGVPPGIRAPTKWNGISVTVESGDVTAAYLLKKHATPVRVNDFFQVSGPVAAPIWRLETIGFTITSSRLFQKQHVMAVPPGENGWLKRLGGFLNEQKSNVKSLLKATEVRQ
jgi:ABC-type amino acid transport substrate-binding protein